MQIDGSKRARSALKTFFAKNAIPTEEQFALLIDSGVNQRDDGVYKTAGDALSIEAAGDDAGTKRAVSFYSSFADPNPAWSIALRPRSAPTDPATGRAGWSVLDATNIARLTIDAANGNVGIGPVAPREKLEVDGRVRAGPLLLGSWPRDNSYAFLGAATLDQAQPINYALLQGTGGDAGATFLNSPTNLYLRIKNEDRLVLGEAEVVVSRPLRLAGTATSITFPNDPGGGGGDGAWLRYFARAGESTTLQIGTANDPDDHIALMPGVAGNVATANVGIGTNAPVEKLDVWGRVRADATTVGAWPANPAYAAIGLNTLDQRQPGNYALLMGVTEAVGRTMLNGAAGLGLRVNNAEKVTVTADTVAVTAGLAVQGDVAIGGKHALRGNDGWLRLNQDGKFPEGTHTPGLFAPNSLNVGAGWNGWGNPGAGNIAYAGQLNKLDVQPQGAAVVRCGDFLIGGAGAGRRATPGRALVDTAERLYVNYGPDWPSLELGGTVWTSGMLRPSAGSSNAGIVWPNDPFGGGGDNAWIKYYARGGEAATLEIGISNDADDHIALMPAGGVGIGTPSPQLGFKLDVQGAIICNGLLQRSSGLLKKDVRPLAGDRAAAIVAGLEPVSFAWKADEDGGEQLGFIAQDCPPDVTTADRAAIALPHVIAALTAVVRDQTATIAALQRRLGRLEAAA